MRKLKKLYIITNSKEIKYILIEKQFNNLKKIIHFLCSILILFFVLSLLIIITIFTGDEELSIPLIRAIISEMVEEIFHIYHIYCTGEPRSESPDPVEAESTATDSPKIYSVRECPCCEIAWDNNKERCSCTDKTTFHELEPPFEGVNSEIDGAEIICCQCENQVDTLITCFACECHFCAGCKSSHFHLNATTKTDDSDLPESILALRK